MNNECTKEQQDRIERLSQENDSLIQESKDLGNELRMYREKYEEALETTRGLLREAREKMHTCSKEGLIETLEHLDKSPFSGKKSFSDLRELISQELKIRSERD